MLMARNKINFGEKMKLVVVESPAKAQTINRYLGKDYKVLASIGHIRDLPSKNGAVSPEENFKMQWDLSKEKEKVVKEIIKDLKKSNSLILATDPDREGEAISWHIKEILKEKQLVDDVKIERVVFNEITKNSILNAMKNPREINFELVEAYLARRALDHLIGFSISPILWRKLPGSKSAGRVQSVALRLICERELEIEKFVTKEYWTISAIFLNPNDEKFSAKLIIFDNNKLKKFDIINEESAKNIIDKVNKSTFQIEKIEKKRVKRNPIPPFTTSSLQQEASRKLGFSAYKSMRIAQKLYEGIKLNNETSGLITYMRTDGVQIGNEAINNVRAKISSVYGDKFLPSSPRIYKSKAANAQEAHEAIRPTNFDLEPQSIKNFLDADQFKLYELIWKRTLSSQMESASLDKTSIDIVSNDQKIIFRANGSQIIFPGFLKVYKESIDTINENGNDDDDENKLIPPLNEKDKVKLFSSNKEQHFTQPPPRFTDASLVKRMEELGIGRPSTYAAILKVLVDRNYVKKEGPKHIPEERGRILTAFLSNFFGKYIQYDFTAELEKKLDLVSDGKLNYKNLLQDFWNDFKLHLDKMSELERNEILKTLENELEDLFFSNEDEASQPSRICPKCSNGNLGLQLGKYGAFIGCSKYPDCKYTKQIAKNDQNDSEFDSSVIGEDGILGTDPDTNENIYIKKGPYGVYIQKGDQKKPKRISIPKLVDPNNIDLIKALNLLSLPRVIGKHPDTNQDITANIGRFGPYLKHGISSASLPSDETILNIGLNHAVVMLSEKSNKGRVIGKHPTGKDDVLAKSGRFGPYVEYKKIRATLPKSLELEKISLEEALELIEKKSLKIKNKKRK